MTFEFAEPKGAHEVDNFRKKKVFYILLSGARLKPGKKRRT
jgi:hypothetical protein